MAPGPPLERDEGYRGLIVKGKEGRQGENDKKGGERRGVKSCAVDSRGLMGTDEMREKQDIKPSVIDRESGSMGWEYSGRRRSMIDLCDSFFI